MKRTLARIKNRNIGLSNLDKVLFPADLLPEIVGSLNLFPVSRS